MGKVLLGIMMWFMVSGVAFGYTYQQEINAGQAKLIDGDYVGARTHFENALILAGNETDKSEVDFFMGQTYFKEKNYVKTREVYTKIVTNESAHILFIAEAQYHIATSYMRENNNAQAIIEWTKFLTLSCGEEDLSSKKIILEYKETALKRLNTLNANWSEVISGMTMLKDWSSYFYRAKAKRMLPTPDNAGAKVDIIKAMSLTDDNQAQTTLAEELQRIKLALGEK